MHEQNGKTEPVAASQSVSFYTESEDNKYCFVGFWKILFTIYQFTF